MLSKRISHRLLSAALILSMINIYAGGFNSDRPKHLNSDSCCHTIEIESKCCSSSNQYIADHCSLNPFMSIDKLSNCGCVISNGKQIPYLIVEKVSFEQKHITSELNYCDHTEKKFTGQKKVVNKSDITLSNRVLLQRISTLLI